MFVHPLISESLSWRSEDINLLLDLGQGREIGRDEGHFFSQISFEEHELMKSEP